MSCTEHVGRGLVRRQFLLPLALLLSPLVCLGEAAAFGVLLQNSYPLSWPQDQVGFEVDADGTSDISDGSDRTAIQISFAAWNDVSCSTIGLFESGTTNQTDTLITTQYTDDINRIAWVEDSRWPYGSYVLGVTNPVFNYYGEISEADIAFNGYSTDWETNGAGNVTDVESVVVHELGHAIGMQHVLNGQYAADPPTMSPAVDPHLRTRGLTSDDMSGACYLYPQSTYSCAGDCDCPALVDIDGNTEFNSGRMACNSGTCSGTGGGSGNTNLPLGSACADSDACLGALFCQQTPYGSFCSEQCDPNASACATGFACYPYDGSSGGACLDANLGRGGSSGETCLAGVGSGGGGTGVSCSCDITFACDDNCSCDTECRTTTGGGSLGTGGGGSGGTVHLRDACPCDTTTNCDNECTCDPECGGGCSVLAPRAVSSGAMPTFVSLLGLLVLRRLVYRRRRV